MADVVVKITADSQEFKDKIEEIKKSSEGLENRLSTVAKISGAAFAGLTAIVVGTVKSYAESEKATKELTLALQNQGIYTEETAESYKKFAEIVQEKTGIDDDALVASQAILQSFLGQTQVTQELTQAVADLSIKTGSTSSAAEILGRAVQGNTRGLKQFGIEVDEGLTRNQRLAVVLEQVGQKFGGLAANANSGLGGVKGLQDSFSSFSEEIGKRFAPVFTLAINKTTMFFRELAKNQPLLDFITEALKIGLVLTGAVTAFATTALAVVKVSQAIKIASAAMEILGLSTRVLVGATGIGLLLIIAAEIYLNWNKIFPAIQAVYETFAKNLSNISAGLGEVIAGIFTASPSRIKAGIAQLKAVVTEGLENIKNSQPKEGELSLAKAVTSTPEQIANAKKASDKIAQQEQDKIDALEAQKELIKLVSEKSSADLIELKKKEIEILKQFEDEKYASQRENLIIQLETNQALQEEQLANDSERLKNFNELQLTQTAEFQKKNETQKNLFLVKNQATLLASLKTEKEVRDKVLLDDQKNEIDAQNKKLADRVKYGAAVAQINATLNSQEVTAFRSGADSLVQLSNSKNNELKAIGKAAAITQIGIDSAKGAMAAYANFQVAIPFPPVSIPLGIAAAAGIIAYGGERIAGIVSAERGGVIPGFNQGGDSVQSFLQPGEFVVPRSNFEEVINSVASQRSSQSTQASSGIGERGGNSMALDVRFSGDGAEKFLTARQVESRSLGTLAEASA